MTFDHSGGVLTSKDGIELIIPKSAIKKGDLVTFNVEVGMCGPFVLPSKSQADLASPYYWIGVSRSYHFQKSIQVEFEHYGACDPSHYRLLTCEDDDESYTMQPVDYDLSFTKQENMLCKFQTFHCCSFCLQHNHKHTNVNAIAALFLKPKNFQSLHHFTLKPDKFESQNYFSVEIWFSFIASYCLNRNKELYEGRGMTLDRSYQFEASSDINSKNYFTLQYQENINGWKIDDGQESPRFKENVHGCRRFKEIEAKEVNFHNDPNIDEETLKAKEENMLFPPFFKLYIKNPNSPYNTTELDTNITVSLYNNKEEKKELDSTNFKLLVPKCSLPMKGVSKPSNSDLPIHICYKPELTELIRYSMNIATKWKPIALALGISEYQIDVININSLYDVEDKCYEMFRYWLQTGNPLCWCCFVQALRTVELCNIAEMVARKHLNQYSESTSVPVLPTGSLVQDKGILNPSRLMRYLRLLNNEIESDLLYFVTLLLPDNGLKVAKAIKCGNISKEKKFKEICDAFLKEETASWKRLHKALEEAGFTKVAETVKICHL